MEKKHNRYQKFNQIINTRQSTSGTTKPFKKYFKKQIQNDSQKFILDIDQNTTQKWNILKRHLLREKRMKNYPLYIHLHTYEQKTTENTETAVHHRTEDAHTWFIMRKKHSGENNEGNLSTRVTGKLWWTIQKADKSCTCMCTCTCDTHTHTHTNTPMKNSTNWGNS